MCGYGAGACSPHVSTTTTTVIQSVGALPHTGIDVAALAMVGLLWVTIGFLAWNVFRPRER